MSSPTEKPLEPSSKVSKRPKPSPPTPLPIRQSTDPEALPISHPKDTPRVKRHRINADQAKMQTQIANDMCNEIVETDWDLFKEHYMEFFPSNEELDTYMQAILKSQPSFLQSSGLGYKFRNRFKDVKLHEDKFFYPLGLVISTTAAVVENIRHDSKHLNRDIRYKFMSDPTRRIISSISGATHKIDGYFYSAAAEDRDYTNHFTSVAVCAEFKKQEPKDLVLKNRRQIVTDAHFVMNNDPRRIFTFGITIEGESCCVWYFSRSHTAKSTSFKWKGADLPQFIGTIIAFTFANPLEVGYDSSIVLFRSPKECFVYRIDEVAEDDKAIKSRFFKTENCISELHTTCISGRATRVWKAVEVKNAPDWPVIEDAQTVVLKDVWLDENAQTERSIQTQIFESIDAFRKKLSKIPPGSQPPEFKNLDDEFRRRITNLLLDGDRYRDHFLTIVADAVAKPSKTARLEPGRSGARADLLHKSDPPPPVEASAAEADPSRASQQQSHPGSHMEPKRPAKKAPIPRTFTAKKRYRVVFEEVCSAIHFRTSFSEVMTAMEGALLAIFLLFASGWVHRDISSGNILWYNASVDACDASRGILADLEYAKKYPQDEGSADPKTGTPYFMPTEVLKGHYFLQQTAPRALSLAELMEVTKTVASLEVLVPRRVKHNFVHDMESFFWLFLWIICTAFPKPHPRLVNEAQTIFSDTFRDADCQNEREAIVTGGNYIKGTVLTFLHSSLSNVHDKVIAMTLLFNNVYTTVPVPASEQDDCEKYRKAISIVFTPAMSMIESAKTVNAPAIHFKPILALGVSQEPQKLDAANTSTVVSQNKHSDARAAVNNSMQSNRNDMPPPPKRSRTSKDAEPPEMTRVLRSRSRKDGQQSTKPTRSQSSGRSKPSGSRKSRTTQPQPER